MRSPLKSGQLRRIVAAYTVNRLGTWFGFVALSVAVFDHTHSTIAVGGLLLAGQVLPAFIVPVLVAHVEGSKRRGELTGLYLFEALTSAILVALLVWHFVLAAVLVLVAVDGTAALAASALLRAAAARSARQWARAASLSEEPDELHAGELDAERRANAALNLGFAVTFVMGPALAGVVVPTLGAPAALLIDMVSFVICGAMLIDLRPHVEDAAETSIRERLRVARSYIGEAATLRRLLIAEAVALAFFEFSPPIEVEYAKVSLHAGDVGYGLLLGTWGLGVAVGSVVFARSIGRPLGILLSGSTLAIGAAYLGWFVAPTLAVACAAGLIGGVGNGVQWAALISAVQRLTPTTLQGQMMGAVESIGAIAPGVGFALGSAIVALSTPRIAFLVAGIGASVTTVAFMRLHIGVRAQPDEEAHETETLAA